MGYTMNGSPAKLGTIQGTSGHASAVKQSELISLMKKKPIEEMDVKLSDQPIEATKTAEEVQGEIKAEKAQSSKKTHRLREKLKKQEEKSLKKGHKTKKQTRLEDKLAHSEKMDTDPKYRAEHKEMQLAKASDILRSGLTDPDKLGSLTASQDALRKRRTTEARTDLAEKRLEHDVNVEKRRGEEELDPGETFVTQGGTGSEELGSEDITEGESKYKVDWKKYWKKEFSK